MHRPIPKFNNQHHNQRTRTNNPTQSHTHPQQRHTTNTNNLQLTNHINSTQHTPSQDTNEPNHNTTIANHHSKSLTRHQKAIRTNTHSPHHSHHNTHPQPYTHHNPLRPRLEGQPKAISSQQTQTAKGNRGPALARTAVQLSTVTPGISHTSLSIPVG